ESHARGCHTANNRRIRAGHRPASQGHQGRPRARRERSPGAPQSRCRAPCGWDLGVRRWPTAGAIRAPTSKWEVMEVPGVATYYTAHLFSIQAKYFVGEKKETRSMRRLVAALVPCCPCGSGAKERLFFLYACFSYTLLGRRR